MARPNHDPEYVEQKRRMHHELMMELVARPPLTPEEQQRVEREWQEFDDMKARHSFERLSKEIAGELGVRPIRGRIRPFAQIEATTTSTDAPGTEPKAPPPKRYRPPPSGSPPRSSGGASSK